MNKFTNQKGITLIALIITIIIMLILVGVTVSISLQGGLINKAKTASEQTQIEADKETLMLAALRDNRFKWKNKFKPNANT